MRTTTLAAGVFSLSLAACSLTPERVQESEVNQDQKVAAQALATRLYEACNSERFEALGDEAIPAMRDALSVEKQRTTCTQIKGQFGEWNSMRYVETWRQDGLAIYRFKGRFAKGDEPEIRVVTDRSSKLAGFWLKPWSDALR